MTNAPEQTIVCTINCVGTMGAGLAKTVRDKYPLVNREYRRRYRANQLHADSLFTVAVSDTQQILCFPTKLHWKDPSPTRLILANLTLLTEQYVELGITSLALVPLGLGLGWNPERKRILLAIKEACECMPIMCTLYV